MRRQRSVSSDSISAAIESASATSQPMAERIAIFEPALISLSVPRKS